jgi:hypothetical protein
MLALAMATGSLWAAGASTGYAGLIATTGPATSVTTTSGTLHGVALTINPSSAWGFQYGPTQAYGATTAGSAVGLGLTAVSATVTGLTPGTTYHFRLVVLQGSYLTPSNWTTGEDQTFTTAPAVTHGVVSLPSHRLVVSGHLLSIPIRCSGGSCNGTVALRARGRHGTGVDCGTATVTLRSGQRGSLQPTIGAACARLLRHAPSHTIEAALFGAFSGAAKPLADLVTLIT